MELRNGGTTAECARIALWRQFRGTNAASLDEHGYVSTAQENLLSGIELADFARELNQGGGSELEPRTRNGHPMKPKFQAVHSSCALAVNAFGPLKRRTDRWDWPALDIPGLGTPRFEAKLPTGIRGSLANLDVLFDTGKGLLGVESKLTEYLTPKVPHFAPAFAREKLDVEQCWWNLIEKHRDAAAPEKKLLDEARLIKHYLGLRRAVRPYGEYPGRSVTLLYLFWEPLDASAFAVFQQHRAEIRAFESSVRSSDIRFRWMTYQALWDAWKRSGFMAAHVDELRRRYSVRIREKAG